MAKSCSMPAVLGVSRVGVRKKQSFEDAVEVGLSKVSSNTNDTVSVSVFLGMLVRELMPRQRVLVSLSS